MQRDASVINYRLRNFPPSNLDFDRMLIAFGIDRFRVFDDENRFISFPSFLFFFFLSFISQSTEARCSSNILRNIIQDVSRNEV